MNRPRTMIVWGRFLFVADKVNDALGTASGLKQSMAGLALSREVTDSLSDDDKLGGKSGLLGGSASLSDSNLSGLGSGPLGMSSEEVSKGIQDAREAAEKEQQESDGTEFKGVQAQAGFWGLGGAFSLGVVTDDDDIGLQFSVGGGRYLGADLSVGYAKQYTDADDISELEGWSKSVGVSVGVPVAKVGGGGEKIHGDGYEGWGWSGGVGLGTPVSVYGFSEYSTVLSVDDIANAWGNMFG